MLVYTVAPLYASTPRHHARAGPPERSGDVRGVDAEVAPCFLPELVTCFLPTTRDPGRPYDVGQKYAATSVASTQWIIRDLHWGDEPQKRGVPDTLRPHRGCVPRLSVSGARSVSPISRRSLLPQHETLKPAAGDEDRARCRPAVASPSVCPRALPLRLPWRLCPGSPPPNSRTAFSPVTAPWSQRPVWPKG